ncbi:bifunctional DNA-formamidopyrimidine glycosylase/DNA-(apurinic or apyrimidinic site) lyase [Paenibacillus sp. HJGM_3]|uniref:bifunctional DNA-formamidopyrimidine glycosylase/DNA-(apurinic or apyrimidinic site) lyase n=1 Tax=Paenibacillus sp. HJGM_3 TaxID=3379816 RepID=UPI00385C7B60
MPELPEMETYRNLLARIVVGQKILEVQVQREKTVNVPVDEFISKVQNSTITAVNRRAKHLLFHLDNGYTLLLHLMLDGWMFYGTEEEKPDRSTQVVLTFGTNSLYFIGLRLGYLHLLDEKQLQDRLSDYGPEPFDPRLDEERFHHLLKRRRAVLKPTLVDQKILAGIGNCYADEFCFHAGILPYRKTADLTEADTTRLLHAMRFILNDGMRHGGYMEFPLYAGDTLTGGYNDQCRVYDRGGEPCLQCGQPIVQEELASRKVFYCTHCQH